MSDIQISGSISTTGVSILGDAQVVFTSDADHVLTVAEYTNNFLYVSSSVDLMGTRNLIAPLVRGQSFVLQNNTTGGQNIQIIGATGTGIMVPSDGSIVSVVCDGYNYLSGTSGSGGGLTTSLVFQPGGTATSNVYTDETLLAAATQALNGAAYTIELDFSFVSRVYVPTTVGVWNLAPNGTWNDSFTGSQLQFLNETTLANLPANILGTVRVIMNQSSDAFTSENNGILTLRDAATLVGGLGLFINDASYLVQLHDSAFIHTNNAHPVLNVNEIDVYDAATIFGSSVVADIIIAFSPAVNIDHSFYSEMVITGLFTDTSSGNVGPTTIPFDNGGYMISGSQLYEATESEWKSLIPSALTTAGGDLSGTYPNPNVIKIQNKAIDSTAPTNGQVLEWNGSAWTPTDLANTTVVLPSIIFQPGGTAITNVYVDEASLAIALQALNGVPYTLFFDFSLSNDSYTLTTVGVWNLGPNGTWTDGGNAYNLIFANETTLSYPPINLQGALQITITQETTVCITSIAGMLTIDSYASIQNDSDSANFLSTSGFWAVEQRGFTSIQGDSVAIFAGNIEIDAYDRATVGALSIDGSGFIYALSPSISIDSSLLPQTSISGLYIDLSGAALANTSPDNSAIGTLLSTNGSLYQIIATDSDNVWAPVSNFAGQAILTNGITSIDIAVPYLDANSIIQLTYLSPNASTAFGFLLPTTITPGAPGSFQITSYTAPNSINTNDQSTVAWSLLQTTPTP